MRKIIIICFVIFAILSSCEMEMSSNGVLDGYWQMTEMQWKGCDRATDMRDSGVYWAVEFKLLEINSLKNKPGYPRRYICRFEHTGETLRVFEPRVELHDISDTLVTAASDKKELRESGLHDADVTYAIIQLTSDRMELKSDSVRMVFRKY